jgi:beta-lactam-binding protein with PASTA domain
MPDLKNLSLRQALVTLEVNGLKAGNLEYVDYFARNAVIDQEINGEPVDPGTEIYKGTVVDLVVGKGEMEVHVPLPFLIGKTPDQARHEIHYASLNIGKEVFMDEDRTYAKVYRTEPEQLSDVKLNLGDTINIWYRSSRDFDFESYINEILGDTVSADTLNETPPPY